MPLLNGGRLTRRIHGGGGAVVRGGEPREGRVARRRTGGRGCVAALFRRGSAEWSSLRRVFGDATLRDTTAPLFVTSSPPRRRSSSPAPMPSSATASTSASATSAPPRARAGPLPRPWAPSTAAQPSPRPLAAWRPWATPPLLPPTITHMLHNKQEFPLATDLGSAVVDSDSGSNRARAAKIASHRIFADSKRLERVTAAEMVADKWALEKAQALQDLEEKFNQQTARILTCYELPEHIRLDLQEQHRNDYKVPDDLRLKFINAVFEGNPGMLDHEGELKVQARKEAEKFWIETAATAKKAQALQDMEEWYKQLLLKHAFDIEGIPERIKEAYIREIKLDDEELKFKKHVEEKFGICNHETQLRVRAWEESQQFRIKTMADKWAAKKLQALQDLEKRYVQRFLNIFDRIDIPDYCQQAYFQKYKVPDDMRLRFINDVEIKFRTMPDDEEEPPKGYISEDYNKLKAQALQDLEYKFNQQTARILKCYDLPEHIRLDLQEQHCNNYKVPDNLRLKFITAVFKGNSGILDHKGELKVQARKEAEKFWIEAAAAKKKTQALQDMEERFKQQFIKPGYARKGIPEHIHKYLLTDCKLHEDTLLQFRNKVEKKFGMRNHETQLKIRAWEKTQQFRIETMADKWAAKKTKALQDMEERYIQDFMNIVDKLDVPEYFQQAYFQEFKVPDNIRLRYINDIEEKFRMLGDKERRKVHIWDSFKKLKMPLTNKSLITVSIMLSIGIVILFSSFHVPGMAKSLKIVCWVTSIVISCAAVLSYDHGSSKRSLLTTSPTETHDLENPPINY